MGMIDDLIAIEDKKFIDTVNDIVEHAKAMEERRPWRDRKGVVHILRPIEAIALNGEYKPTVIGWSTTCNGKRRSPLRDMETVVTCLLCLGATGDDA